MNATTGTFAQTTFPLCVDVTTLVHWQRPAVGIVRVEQQLCLWLLQQPDTRCHFVVYRKDRAVFEQVSAATVSGHLDRIARYGVVQAPGGLHPQRPNLEERLRHRALQLLRHAPAGLQARLHRWLVAARPRVHRLVGNLRAWRQTLHSIGRSPRLSDTATPGLAFELPVGSVYISLGLDWNYKDMVQLYRLKQARQLKVLLFCYDIIPIRLPHLCVADVSRQFAHYFVDLAWSADLILCISQSSQRDLLQFLQAMSAPLPATDVVHLGSDIEGAETRPSPSAEVRLIAQEPFILFVSTIERRKNHEVLYRAYTRLAEEGTQLPKLVFVGMRGWGVDELFSDLALDPRIQGKIHILNHVSDPDLAELYRSAMFTVYPSLYEGWGLPVAESLAYGKFCLCSNTSSLPEVGEDWVEYLDPWDLNAWVDRLRHYILAPQEVARRNEDIARRYVPHAWADTAAAIYRHAQQLYLHSAR